MRKGFSILSMLVIFFLSISIKAENKFTIHPLTLKESNLIFFVHAEKKDDCCENYSGKFESYEGKFWPVPGKTGLWSMKLVIPTRGYRGQEYYFDVYGRNEWGPDEAGTEWVKGENGFNNKINQEILIEINDIPFDGEELGKKELDVSVRIGDISYPQRAVLTIDKTGVGYEGNSSYFIELEFNLSFHDYSLSTDYESSYGRMSLFLWAEDMPGFICGD